MILPPILSCVDRSVQWQAGAITALQERYDMSSLDMVGASAGALAATLAACDADMELAMTLALNLCDENEVSTSAALLERAASVDKQPVHYVI